MAQIVRVLGGRAEKVFACLRTAAAFLAQAHGADGEGLRLVESACYNLREAFDAVVAGHEAAAGGLGEVVEAWRRYELATKGPGADDSAARGDLHAVLRRVAEDEDRQGFRVRHLLAFVRAQTGVEPLSGDGDPLVQYNKLRNQAAGTLHSDGSVAAVSALYDDAVGWFGRYFTPPDDRVRAIVTLAEGPYDADRVSEARDLVVNAHDLRLFFEHVQDPAWLDGLFDAGLIPLPRSGEPWPVATLGREGGGIGSDHVGGLLLRMWNAWVGRQESQQQLGPAREIVICASRLGAAGHEVIEKVLAKHHDDYVVLSMAVSVAKRADPSDPIQLVIARAVVDYDWGMEGGDHVRTALRLVREGLTSDNVRERMKMLAGALRQQADVEKMRYVVVDIAALSTDGDDLREPAIILAQQITKAIPAARALGLPTDDLVAAARKIPGELGERVVCQVLASATDVDRGVKIDHVAQRVTSNTATGDDRDLIDDILTTTLWPDELQRWRLWLPGHRT